MALNRAQTALNLIRTMGSKAYKNEVPALTSESPIESVWNVFTSQPLVYKEFTQLFGAFLELQVMRDSWANVLNELIISGSPLGEFSAVVGSNPATPHKYDPKHPERVLQYAHSNDKVAYYVRNIKEFFKVSFAYEDMKGAFSSYEKFDEYLSMKLSTLESGKQISSYNHIMESIVINYFSGVFVESDVHIDPTTTNYAEWLTEVKSAYDKMQFPNTNYNNYGKLDGANGDFKGWSKPEDIYILATIDWINKVDVSYLASVFNLDKAEVGKRIRKIPSFSYDTHDENGKYLSTIESPIQAMIIDRRAFEFKNDLDLDTSFFNDETLVSNYWKHFWATYQINPLAQALVFTAPAGADTDQNTNFYKVMYNQPSTTTVKVIADDVSSLGATFDDFVIEGVSAKTLDVSTALANAEDVETETEPETVDEAVSYLFAYLTALKTGVASKVNDGEATETTLIELIGQTETFSDLNQNDIVSIIVSRLSAENVLKAGKYVLSEADAEQELDEVSFIISDEMLHNIKAEYGNNIYVKFNISGDDIDDIPITIGFKNKI